MPGGIELLITVWGKTRTHRVLVERLGQDERLTGNERKTMSDRDERVESVPSSSYLRWFVGQIETG